MFRGDRVCGEVRVAEDSSCCGSGGCGCRGSATSISRNDCVRVVGVYSIFLRREAKEGLGVGGVGGEGTGEVCTGWEKVHVEGGGGDMGCPVQCCGEVGGLGGA